MNTDESIALEDPQQSETLLDWSLLHVAVALRANKCTFFLLKNTNLSFIPRADICQEDLEPEQAPHIIDDVDFLLELEIRPLRACVIKKDYEVLTKLWRRAPSWDSCHFYKVVEMFIMRKDHKGLEKFTSHFVNLFYEPSVLQEMLDENADIVTPPIR